MKKLCGLLFFVAAAAFGQSNFADPLQNQAVRLDGGDISALGTITSVGLSAPAEFTVSGSPIVTFGTLGLTWTSAGGNLVLATPDNAAGIPSLRSLAPRDLGTNGSNGQCITQATATTFGRGACSGGAVATDVIWDAAGDLVYGTGADTAVRLAPSTATTLLHSGTTPSWSAVSLTADVTGLLPFANIANGSALSVFGRSANSAGVQASITATAASDQFLQETGSTLAFVNPWIDPQTVWLYSDFIGLSSQQQTPFSNLNSGTGAISNKISASGLANHPGIVTVETGTTTTGYAEYVPMNVDAGEAFFLASGTPFTFEVGVRVTTLSDGTDTYSLRTGMCDVGSAIGCVDGIYFSYVQASDTHWRMNTCSASTCTATNTTTTVNAAQWYALKIVCNSAMTSCAFYVDGVQDAASPLTTNIPINRDTGLYAINILKSAGTTNRIAWIDYCKFFMRLTTAR